MHLSILWIYYDYGFYYLHWCGLILRKTFKAYYGFWVLYVFPFPSAGHGPTGLGRDTFLINNSIKPNNNQSSINPILTQFKLSTHIINQKEKENKPKKTKELTNYKNFPKLNLFFFFPSLLQALTHNFTNSTQKSLHSQLNQNLYKTH